MCSIVTKLKDRNIIKQSYELNNAKYKLSELSLNIIFAFMSEIDNEDKEFKTYKINISELEKKINKRIKTSYLESVSEELLTSLITIKKDSGFLKTTWVSSFEYFSKNRLIEISFDPKLKPYLLSIKKSFVLGDFKELINIRGEYSKRIYLLLKQRTKLKKWKISTEELMNILEVPSSLREYKFFKRRVIVPSIKNINLSSSISVNFNEIKIGRKVSFIEFIITSDNKKLKNGVSATEEWLLKKS